MKPFKILCVCTVFIRELTAGNDQGQEDAEFNQASGNKEEESKNILGTFL